MVCKSIYHWAKDCPDRVKKEMHNDEDSSHVTLFNNDIENCYIESFLSETINKAILDSGCINTVCGRGWIDCYRDTLSENDLKI